jgi:hypothetical protein
LHIRTGSILHALIGMMDARKQWFRGRFCAFG